MEKNEKEFLTVRQLAEKIGYHPQTIYKGFIRAGMPKLQKSKHSRIKIYWPDFVEWWKKRK